MSAEDRDRIELGALVRCAQDEMLERRVGPPDAALVEAATRRAAVRPRRSLVYALPLAAALGALGIALFFTQRDLRFRVDGVSGVLHTAIAPDGAAAIVDFDEGSRLLVEPGARARVDEVGPHGAEVVVEGGTVDVRVAPHPENRWSVRGGPFVVAVVGTEFDVSWEEARQELTVSMRKGTVNVSAPCLPGVRRLGGTERASFRCPPPEIVGETSSASSGGLPTPASADVDSALTAGAPAVSAPPAPAPPVQAWRAMLVRGELREAYTSAESSGLDQAIAVATSGELVDLASGARLGGGGASATRLYVAAREKSPSSDAAALAAFHLGRMAFDGRGAWSEAERWFGVYLAERPRGPLAAEALGRSIECARRAGDEPRARSIATRYLAAFPAGAHAELARSTIGEE